MTASQKNKLNGLLLLVVIVFIAFIFTQNKNKNMLTIKQIKNYLKASQATKIKIDVSGKQFSLALNAQKQWSYVDPLVINALNKRVKKILIMLSFPYSQSYSAKTLNLAELELQPPKASLHINQEQFLFGATDPISAQRYVLYKGNVYLTEDLVYPLLHSRTQGLADMQLIPQGQGVDATSIKTPYVDFYKKNNQWFNQDNQDVSELAYPLLSAWINQKAIGVEQADNTAKKINTVTIKSKTHTFAFDIITLEPYLTLRPVNQNVQYLLSPEDAANLLNTSQTP